MLVAASCTAQSEWHSCTPPAGGCGPDRLVQRDHRLGHPLRGRVDHLAIHRCGAPALRRSLGQRLDDALRSVDFSLGRAEHLIGQLNLAGMNRPFTLSAQRRRPPGTGAVAIGVGEVAKRAIDRA
jgi:hypothetical protein